MPAGPTARTPSAASRSAASSPAGSARSAEDGPIVLTAATAVPPLGPSAPTSIEAVPNNHRLYAWQWFFFAAAAAIIYLLALRSRRRRDLPPEP